MKKILTVARVSEIADAANRIYDAYGRNAAAHTDNFLDGLMAEIKAKADEITQAVKRDQVTSQLEDADAQRDAEVRVLGKLLKGYKTIPVASLKPHGEKLAAIFEKYGAKIADAGYTEESNLIDALLMDLFTADVAPSIAALAGTTEAIANLKNAQAAFANIRGDYDVAMASHKDGKTASLLRKPLLKLINDRLVHYLGAQAMANPGTFGTLAGEVSQVIDTINTTVKARAKKPETPAAPKA